MPFIKFVIALLNCRLGNASICPRARTNTHAVIMPICECSWKVLHIWACGQAGIFIHSSLETKGAASRGSNEFYLVNDKILRSWYLSDVCYAMNLSLDGIFYQRIWCDCNGHYFISTWHYIQMHHNNSLWFCSIFYTIPDELLLTNPATHVPGGFFMSQKQVWRPGIIRFARSRKRHRLTDPASSPLLMPNMIKAKCKCSGSEQCSHACCN